MPVDRPACEGFDEQYSYRPELIDAVKLHVRALTEGDMNLLSTLYRREGDLEYLLRVTDGGPPQPGMEENFLQGWRDGLSESWQRLQEPSAGPAIDWSSVRVDLLEVWEACKRGMLEGGAKLSVRGQSDNHT
ncbi:MAG: hypothetical protein ACR2RL_13910, partial [Gammaproteobacteria bacterium]